MRYTLFYKGTLYKEPECRRPKNSRNLYSTRDKIPKELINFEYLYHCKRSRIKQNRTYIWAVGEESEVSYTFFNKDTLYKEPASRRPKNLRNLYSTRDEIPKELINFEYTANDQELGS